MKLSAANKGRAQGLGFGTAAALVIVWSVQEFGGVQVPGEIAVAVGSLLTSLSNAAVRWWETRKTS